MVNAHIGSSLNSKMEVVIKVEIITIPTLMKLLLIRMVANNRSGFFNRACTLPDELVCKLCNLPFCVGPSEKKATSEPDMAADPNNKSKIAPNPAIIPGVIGLSRIDENIINADEKDSGSKR